MIQSPNVQVAGARLAQAEPVTIQGTQFSRFMGESLTPGDVVAAQISGLPRPANQSGLTWVLLALVALGSGFAFFYLRGRRKPQPVRPSSARQEESLLAELARLDDDFEGGRIAGEAYRRVRAQKKMQLAKLIQRSKEKSGNG